jgi:hypothetical protein
VTAWEAVGLNRVCLDAEMRRASRAEYTSATDVIISCTLGEPGDASNDVSV